MLWELRLIRDTVLCAWDTHHLLRWPWRKALSVAARGHWNLWRIHRRFRREETNRTGR